MTTVATTAANNPTLPAPLNQTHPKSQADWQQVLNQLQSWQNALGIIVPPMQQTAAENTAGVTPTNYAYTPYYAQRYGFLPSASAADNTAALQNCFNAMAQALTNVPAGGTYPDLTYSGPILVIPDGQYNINAAVSVPAYCLVRANKVLLVQTNSSAHHLTCSNPYRIDIEGITFQGGASAWSASGTNTDTSRVRFARCDFQTANVTNYAISQSMQTCNTLIEDCLVTNSPLFVDCNGDFVTIRNCWVNGYLYSTGNKPNNTASVNNRARNMLVVGGSWVPESVGTSTGTRWFNNQGGLLHIVEVQFGAEGSGGLPIVYEFGNCAQGGSPSISVSGTIIEGGQIACGNSSRADRGVINLQGAVPGLMVVKDAQFVAFGQIVSSQGFTSPTLAAWLSSNIFGSNYKFSIDIENIGQEPTVSQLAESVPPELLPFATISYGPRGSYPGFRVLGPLNNPVQEYFPNWANAGVGAVQGAVCGENTNPPSASFFTILTVSKTANGSGGDAACVVEVDISVVGEVAGPIEFMNQAKFRVAILAGRGNTIGYNVTTVNQDNLATGGASPGNILSLQMASLSTTSGAIQLKINTTLSASSTLACWRASIVSAANSAGFGFSLTSS